MIYKPNEYYINTYLNKNRASSIDEYDRCWVYIQKPIRHYMKIKDLQPGEVSILDAGCGDGRYAEKLNDDGFNKIVAVDLYDHLDLHVDYRRASIDDLPFEPGTFDVIYCMSVIYHLPNVEKGLRELNRCLKKDGILIITAHTKYSLFTLKNKIKIKLNMKSVSNLKNVHFDYSIFEYKKMLDNTGYKTICVDGFEMTFFYRQIYLLAFRVIRKLFHISLPRMKPHWSKNKIWGIIKSIFGYHAVILVKKRYSGDGC